MSSISRSFDQIRSLSPKLNKATDDANKTVLRVEQFLDECSLGLPAEVFCYAGADNRFEVSLGYTRRGNRYRIVVVTTRFDVGEDEHIVLDENGDAKVQNREERPWCECARDIKLETIPQLPALIEALASNAEKSIKAAEEATLTVEKILSATQPTTTEQMAAQSASRAKTTGHRATNQHMVALRESFAEQLAKPGPADAAALDLGKGPYTLPSGAKLGIEL